MYLVFFILMATYFGLFEHHLAIFQKLKIYVVQFFGMEKKGKMLLNYIGSL
jgi:hypothetical protein